MLKKTINILSGKNIGMKKIKSKYDKIMSYKRKDGGSKKLEIAQKGNKYFYRFLETDQHVMGVYHLFDVPIISKFKPITKEKIDAQLNKFWEIIKYE